jgi:hypothetical protein
MLAATSCGSRAASLARGPDRRAMVRLERQAQRELHCPQAMRIVALSSRAYQVDGCGQMREYAWACPTRRCSFVPMTPAVLRASEDLQCAPTSLAGAAQTSTHRAFFGCGRGAAYELECVEHGCVWARTPEQVALAGAPTSPTGPMGPASAAPVGDPSLADAVIPPPPGSSGTGDPPPLPPPPASGAGPTATSSATATIPTSTPSTATVPPPPSSPTPSSASGDPVIPPPPT